MKNFGKSKKNFKAASAASKTFAWVLSIMLVVTGIAPSFAENGKVGNAGVAKKAATSEQAGMKKTYANKATAVSKENTQKNNNNSVNIKAKEQKKKKSDKKATASKEKSSNNKGKKFAFKKKVYKDEGKDDDEAAPRQSRLSKKKAVELKKDVAYDVNMMIQNGYSSYYKNSDNSSKTPKIQNTNLNYLLKTRAAKNIASSMKFLNLKKTKDTPKDQNGKKNKFRNKREELVGEAALLNASGNVKAQRGQDNFVHIFAKNTSGDMRIDRELWATMFKKIGIDGSYSASNNEIDWKASSWGVKIDTRGIRLPQDSSCFFYNMTGKVEDFDKLVTSEATDMKKMFRGCTNLNGINISRWNVSKVLDMSEMFLSASGKNSGGGKAPDISKWRVNNVTSMYQMFYASRFDFVDFDISKWNVSSVTDMRYIFAGSTIQKLDLSKWELNTALKLRHAPVGTPVEKMFVGCSLLEYLKLPKGLITNMQSNGGGI